MRDSCQMESIPKLDLNGTTNEHEEQFSSLNDSESNSTNLLSKAICNRPLEGIYVRPSDHDILEWFGVIVVKAGVFAGGIFRFTLTLPATFPESDQVPTIELDQGILHPLVYPKTNRVDFKRFFPSNWVPDRNKVYHVLSAFQSIFFRYQCDVEVAANPEAALLWKENRKQFKQFANMAVRESRTQIYDAPKSDDSQAFRFKPWDASVMEPVRNAILGKTAASKEVSSYLSKTENPFGSFFRAEKTLYLCEIFKSEDNDNTETLNDQLENEDDDEPPPSFYEDGDQSD
ncbi:AKT-interacting protein [Aphelenchoides besseyi]|nr:AKT-interacting protein [Aphelenchoides besseyi]